MKPPHNNDRKINTNRWQYAADSQNP